ncbi:hypothetical protein CFC21_017876, partial [Triticum aestivum]
VLLRHVDRRSVVRPGREAQRVGRPQLRHASHPDRVHQHRLGLLLLGLQGKA